MTSQPEPEVHAAPVPARAPRTVAVAGLGAIGGRVARTLADGIPGLRLAAVSARRVERARDIAGPGVAVLPLAELGQAAEIVVEALPPACVAEVLETALPLGRTVLVASVGALLAFDGLEARAAAHGARIVVPSGAIAGLDGLRAGREAGLRSVSLVTRKPLAGFADRVSVGGTTIDLAGATEPVRLFAGSAREAVAAFPVNVNVAAAVSFAGLGPDHTRVEVWADPAAELNCHTLAVESEAGTMTLEIANFPDPANPRTSGLTAFSMIAALRDMGAAFRAGT